MRQAGIDHELIVRVTRHFDRLLWLVALTATALPLAAAANARERAQQAYERAVSLRRRLDSRPEGARRAADYQKVIRAFQAVYHTDPTYQKTPAALAAVGELYRERGRKFSEDADYEASIKAYEFLIAQYPQSSLARDSQLIIGEIYNSDLGRPEDARRIYQEFLAQYPKSAKAITARQALKQIDDEQGRRAAAAASPPLEESVRSGQVKVLNSIRRWMGPDYTRIVVGVEDEVQFNAQRVANPDRLVFDLANTRLSPALVGKTFPVEGGLLHQIRVAQYKPTVTRVVLDVEQVDDYSVFTLPNPFRLVIDVHARPKASSGKASNSAGLQEGGASGAGSKSAPGAVFNRRLPEAAAAPSTSSTATLNSRSMADQPESSAAPDGEDGNLRTTPAVVTPGAEAGGMASTSSEGRGAKASPASDLSLEATRSEPDTDASHLGVTKARSNAAHTPDSLTQTSVPAGNGSRTLTRALGLKVNRIVIDAGHGGHDTGTIGPTGLREKDLVLDVALRLKKLIVTKMGSEVVLTRSDDTFIPLEERTAIANQKNADLFISIHANASRDRSARGIETYYLNFTSNPEALEVAARENATSQESVHRLQQLIEKIALTEKIQESKELASQIQHSVYAQIAQSAGQERDRGLKKAPFVVLIGANMPSVLSEISFLTNPRDESLLKRASYRQRVAEALYRGIARYANNLGGLNVAQESGVGLGEPAHPVQRARPSSTSHSSPADTPDF